MDVTPCRRRPSSSSAAWLLIACGMSDIPAARVLIRINRKTGTNFAAP